MKTGTSPMHEDVQRQIRAWLHSQPDWLQQAAETLLSLGTVPAAQVQILAERLKTAEGKRVTRNRAFDGIVPAPPPAAEVRLLEVGDISGIENLGPSRPLGFGGGNLSVIYGHNGSGKSGYTRLFKKAAGKPRAMDLKPNVFTPTPANRSCRIKYSVDGCERQVQWSANSAPVDDLGAVDIFDADAAVFYIAQEAAVTYTPASVALFEALADVCDQIKKQLQEQQDRLVSLLPALPPEYAASPAGTSYRSLRASLTEEAIQQTFRWGVGDVEALEQLTERLKVDDPASLARNKRQTKAEVDQLTSLLRTAAAAFSQERLAAIHVLLSEAKSKRRVATESARVTSAKLEGVGEDTWRALWEAGRAYSQIAYPGKDFPVTDDALCVLCHQILELPAQERLRDFERFIQGTLESDARKAETAYSQARDELPTVPTDEQIATRCQAAGLTEDGWAERFSAFWGLAGAARETLRREGIEEPASPVTPPNEILEELASRSERLGREAMQHDQNATAFDRARATQEKLNLEARRWIAQQAPAIRAEVARLRQIDDYEKWKRAANSGPISVKASEIAERVITQALVDRFNQELKALGASRIRVKLKKTRSEKGRVLHRLLLEGAKSDQAQSTLILSDGERRIVSLAAFLADSAGQPHSAPFIFDDPVSSLDHEYERSVASRLVQLARSRQVLVLTHRLSLYGAIEDAADEFGQEWKRKHLYQHCIESFAGVAGVPTDQEAWAATTATANNILLDRLGEARRSGNADGPSAYRRLAQGICADFRKLVERTVEEDLLNKVVKRHRRSVTTDNRLAPLSLITPEDCRLIDQLMAKYSPHVHSQSDEAPAVIPEEPELRADLESLKAWREEFKKRSRRSCTSA